MSQEFWKITTLAQRAEQALLTDPFLSLFYIILSLAGVAGFVTLLGLIFVYVERKVAAHYQCRLGPMRVGFHGLLQPLADALKLVSKEDLIPTHADRFLFLLAPFLVLVGTLLGLIIIPISPNIQVIDLHIGVVYVAAVSGFGTLGVLLGGWSSNNKWSTLGAMRAGAQIVSYEVSATLCLLVVVLFSGSLKLSEIVLSQQEGWWIWRAHGVGVLAFVIFIISSVAELNRAPFDMAEAESELTAGFHTEYSGIRFSLFFLAEYINMFIASGLAVTLFLGGWMPFHIGDFHSFNQIMDLIPPGLWFAVKISFVIFLIISFRWTFPRLRVDQLMRLEWKVLLPIGFANLFLAAILVLTGFYFY